MHDHAVSRRTLGRVIALIACALSVTAAAQSNGGVARISKPGQYSGYSQALYDGHQLTSQYVAMRDGTRLAVDIFRPTLNGKVIEDKLPVLWMHTPYNRRNFIATGSRAADYPGFALRLVEYGYVVAVADFRGLYASFGRNIAFNRGEWIDAARMDAYDITEWLAKQPWSTGKIGMWGCSATGGSQLQAAHDGAAASESAVFPMSCEFDAYPFGVPGGMAPPRATPTQPSRRGSSPGMRDRPRRPVDGDDRPHAAQAAIAEHAKQHRERRLRRRFATASRRTFPRRGG